MLLPGAGTAVSVSMCYDKLFLFVCPLGQLLITTKKQKNMRRKRNKTKQTSTISFLIFCVYRCYTNFRTTCIPYWFNINNTINTRRVDISLWRIHYVVLYWYVQKIKKCTTVQQYSGCRCASFKIHRQHWSRSFMIRTTYSSSINLLSASTKKAVPTPPQPPPM